MHLITFEGKDMERSTILFDENYTHDYDLLYSQRVNKLKRLIVKHQCAEDKRLEQEIEAQIMHLTFNGECNGCEYECNNYCNVFNQQIATAKDECELLNYEL